VNGEGSVRQSTEFVVYRLLPISHLLKKKTETMQKVISFLSLLTVIRNAFSTDWYCIDIQETAIAEGVIWKTENCYNDATATPDLTVNSVWFNLDSTVVRAIPAVSGDPNNPMQTLPEMAAQNEKLIAGINGGYFWRVDIEDFWIDDVCRGKTRDEANHPASSSNVNYGVSDGLVKIDGTVVGNNCNCSGYSRPAILAIDGEQSTINVVYRAETVDASIQNAIAAGPNLVSYNSSNEESFIDIPSDDDNINILEHAANTAVGIRFANKISQGSPAQMILITTDGSDECGPKDISCGLNSNSLASLMKDHFLVSVAMSMDQGGSTTMWVKGANPERNGVVSRSHNDRPEEEDGPRHVANGLFVSLI
jgi:exopolysaccharide biosynthesis protein